ncbi:MAG: hypothetical protein PHS14_19505 [Elusimicrobia bacterium]|nr:hypothetical protein [Elusimicrobiota bacterium]
MARKAPAPSQSEFTEAELEALREKARVEVADQRKKAQARELLEQFKEEELARLEPTLEMVEVLIDVPGYTNYIMVDGRIMNQGEIVTVPAHTAAAIREIVQNAWRHERSNGGAHMKAYMPPTTAQVSALAGSSGHKLSRV